MGRAGGSGGRSGGSGGFRSSGSRSGSSGFSTSKPSSSSSHSSGFSSPSRRSTPPPPPRRSAPPPPPRHSPPPPRYNNYGRPSRFHNGYSGGYSRGGCLGAVAAVIGLVAIVMGLIFLSNCISCAGCLGCLPSQVLDTGNHGGDPGNNPPNNPGSVANNYATERGAYFEDHLEMNLNTSAFERNMQEYKTKTGINPFVYTCESYNGRTDLTDGDLESIYSRLNLKDTVLLVFQEKNDRYGVWVYIDDSISIEQFPDENINIMIDYIIANYESNMSNAQLLSGAFLATI